MKRNHHIQTLQARRVWNHIFEWQKLKKKKKKKKRKERKNKQENSIYLARLSQN